MRSGQGRPIIGRSRMHSGQCLEVTMAYYRSVGEIPRKRHTQFRQPDGSLYAEELMGVEGFSSDASLLYHRHLPTAIVSSEVYDAPVFHRQPNHPLKPRHFTTHKLDGAAAAKDAV